MNCFLHIYFWISKIHFKLSMSKIELLIFPTQTKSFPVSFISIYGTISHSVGPSHMPYLIHDQVLLAVIGKRIILNLITFSHLYYCSYSSHDYSSSRLLLPRSPPCLTLCSTPTSYSTEQSEPCEK